MAIIEFHFKPSDAWTMAPACGNVLNSSINPAPSTKAGIYIIHNSHENTTYVGYAENAAHRWATRTESFHCFGIPQIYGLGVLCAWCEPTSTGSSIMLKGQHAAEHLLIRSVVNGLLGVTTCSNTTTSKTPFINPVVKEVRVYLPSDPWGKLQGAKFVKVKGSY